MLAPPSQIIGGGGLALPGPPPLFLRLWLKDEKPYCSLVIRQIMSLEYDQSSNVHIMLQNGQFMGPSESFVHVI